MKDIMIELFMKTKDCFLQDGIFVKTICMLVSIDNSCFQVLDSVFTAFYYSIIECTDRIMRELEASAKCKTWLDLVGWTEGL